MQSYMMRCSCRAFEADQRRAERQTAVRDVRYVRVPRRGSPAYDAVAISGRIGMSMGLLSSDNSSHVLLSFVHKYGNRASILLYVTGIITFAVFISEQWSEKTYFSDNALLPGLVNREFVLTSRTDSMSKVLLEETRKSSGNIPYEWIEQQFRSVGLEVHHQNFTLTYPLHQKPPLHGRNVFAIFRAPRAPSTESLVLSVPFRADGDPRGSTRPSIVLMLALAKYFASKNYWAKDIIFLISDADLLGTQAWLNAYHAEKSTGPLTSSPLTASSGPIQAAVNLELHATQMTSIDIKIEGLNGQLPNLDLFNVAVELCTRESVTPTFHRASHPYAGPEFEVWKQYAETILSMMRSQAASWPTGAHGLFQRFAIQSITLASTKTRSGPASDRQYGGVRLQQAGRVVEGIFRSLNNLLERFNRSYWFYLLPSTRRYLSIGYYMIPFALITSPLILTALRGYIGLSYGKQEDQEDPSGRQETNRILPVEVGEESERRLEDGIPFWFFAHLMGLILVSIPYIMEQHAYTSVTTDSHSTHNVIYVTIVSFSVILIVTPMMSYSANNKLSQKVICLLNAALLFSCISLINISLALVISLICTPVLCVVGQPVTRLSRLRSLANKLLLLLIHPISMNYSSHLVMSMYSGNSELAISDHLSRAFHSQKASLLSCIENWYIFGHWIYLLSCAFLFPVWLQAWSSTS